MTITKVLTAAGIGTAIVVGSLLAVSTANAHMGGGSDTIASELATRFNLNEGEVESFFEEKRQEHKADMDEKRAQHIASLVENGTLTQEQADALTAKLDEMHTKREAVREENLSRDERHEQMEQLREEFESWAESQGIDLDVIHPEGGHGHHARAGGM